MKQHHERRARQWSSRLRLKEAEHEAKVLELSEQLIHASTKNGFQPLGLSLNDITSWAASQDTAWNRWATTFGHSDGDRLRTGLHPHELQQLSNDIGGFVRMPDTGGLPTELLTGGTRALKTLLNGMLAHFICAEIIASPMWVLIASTLGTMDGPRDIPPISGPGLLRQEGHPESTSSAPWIIRGVPEHDSDVSWTGLLLNQEMESILRRLVDGELATGTPLAPGCEQNQAN